jgi:hypothetical protein
MERAEHRRKHYKKLIRLLILGIFILFTSPALLALLLFLFAQVIGCGVGREQMMTRCVFMGTDFGEAIAILLNLNLLLVGVNVFSLGLPVWITLGLVHVSFDPFCSRVLSLLSIWYIPFAPLRLGSQIADTINLGTCQGAEGGFVIGCFLFGVDLSGQLGWSGMAMALVPGLFICCLSVSIVYLVVGRLLIR